MGWLIGTILMVLAIPLCFWLARVAKRSTDPDAPAVRTTMIVIGLGLVLGAAILTLASSCATVSTKNVGIETSFGATSGELGNGLHFIPPWYGVTEMDAAIQTDSYTAKNCLDVRIANQQTACVHVSIRWRIRQKKSQELFRDFRTFEHVRDSLVTRDLTAAVNSQFADYNPLNSVLGGVLPKGQQHNPSLTTIAGRVTKQMQKEIGQQIEVLSTIIPIVTFDDATQSRINQLQQQIALTRIAQQAEETAKAQAKANQALAASVSHAPNVLVAHCYDILSQMVKNGLAVPAGFSCWPGGGVAAVIAASTPAKK